MEPLGHACIYAEYDLIVPLKENLARLTQPNWYSPQFVSSLLIWGLQGYNSYTHVYLCSTIASLLIEACK